MRVLLFAALLFLAACGSPATPTPTATAIPPTAAPPTDPPVSVGGDPLGTLAATIPVPEPGTLVVPSNLETPNAAAAAPIIIDRLGFTQSGGLAGTTLTIVLNGDGTLVRDGVASTVSQDQVQSLAALLDSLHFFDMNGIFTGAETSPDTYRYTIVVESSGRRRTISSQDGLTPPELYQLYDAIRALGSA